MMPIETGTGSERKNVKLRGGQFRMSRNRDFREKIQFERRGRGKQGQPTILFSSSALYNAQVSNVQRRDPFINSKVKNALAVIFIFRI